MVNKMAEAVKTRGRNHVSSVIQFPFRRMLKTPPFGGA